MKNKQFLEKSLELIAFGESILKESKDKQEIREMGMALKIQKQILRSTGYREPRIKVETVPNPNIFREMKAKVDAERLGETVKEIDNSHQALDKAKAELVKKLNSGKKVRTTDKDKKEITALFKAERSISDISETLWIEEDTIYKVLGISRNDSKAVIADNIQKEGLND
jgi:hypothetical protein